MEAARANLRIIDTATGEVKEIHRCPHCSRMEAEVEEITRKMKGALLEARSARAERHAKLWASERRPEIELLHTLHHRATEANADTPTRKKRLDTKELEQSLSTLKTLGFRACLEAIVGNAYDPSWGRPGKNSKKPCFNTFELALRDSTKAQQFAERIPNGWQPKPERISELGGVPVDWVRELLGEDV